MLQARRALLVLVSVVAGVACFAPAAFARPGTAAAAPSAVPAVAVRNLVLAESTPAAAVSRTLGYYLAASDGGIFAFGDARFRGSLGAISLNRPIVGVAPTPSGRGYWLVSSIGVMSAFGDAGFYGSTHSIHLNLSRPLVGIAPTPSGRGYWLVASDGGIFAFGDARFSGSTGAMHLNRPIVGIAPTPSGRGYWLVASDGGIFAFGDARFSGSTGAMHLNRPIVGMTRTPSGRGYWLVASDGGIFAFGDATFHGSTGAIALNQPIVGMAATASGNGYWLVAADGGVFAFGDAGFFGSASGLAHGIMGMIAAVAVAPPAKLAFTTQPGASTGGSAFATQPVVTVQSAAGATVTGDTSSVRLTLTTPAGATLTCAANPKAAVAGVAMFAGCKIDRVGTYTLRATDGALTSAVSSSVTITVGVAAKLAFTTQPSGAVHGVAFGTQPAVSIRDAGGNLVAGNTTAVTLAITPPAGGATVNCTANPKTAVAGVATFAGCSVSLAGTYTLTATDGALTAALSTPVAITGVAAKLAFIREPSGAAVSDSPFAVQPVVIVEDATGHLIVADTSSVTLTLTTPAGATLICTANPKVAVTGIAVFAGCNIDLVGTYTLSAADGALTSAVSSNVTITVGVAAKLAFTTQPSGAVHGVAFGTQPAVTVQDLAGNTVTTDTSSVTLAITAPAGGATLTCTANTKAAVAGVATFSGCTIDLTGTYTLTATDGTLTAAVSSNVPITGPAAKLAFTTEPSGAATGGSSFAAQPVVTVQDATGHTIVGDTSSVTLTLTTPAGATLTCTANPKAAVAGVATFAACNIDLVGTYTLSAADGVLTSAVSTNVTITVGPAAQLAFTTQPVGAAGGVTFVTQPKVTVQDLGGNTVTTDTSSVTLAITAPARGATLLCNANPKAAVNGVAHFGGCQIDLAGSYTLTASDGVLTSAISDTVTIT